MKTNLGKMIEITFTTASDEKSFYDPDLIAALEASDENTDLKPLYEKYGYNTVVAAMFCFDPADCHPDSDWYWMGEDRVEEWLWEEYDNSCRPYIEEFFLKRNMASDKWEFFERMKKKELEEEKNEN